MKIGTRTSGTILTNMKEHVLLGLCVILFGPLVKGSVPDIENLSATTLRANYLTSPGYPMNYRSVSSSDCQWRISAPIGTFVKVEVMFLSTSSSSLCIYDYLLFIDGSSTDSTRLAKLCRPTSRYIISTSNYMTITFHTDGLERKWAFRLKYTAVSQSCGSTLSASSIIPKNLTSPGYPSNYPNNIDCQWTLRAPIGRNVKVDVLFLAMESSRSCSNDYLMFNDGTSSNARRLKRICHKISDSIISSGRYLTISFHTDINLWDKGFRLLYTAGTFGPHRSIVVNYYETSYVQSPNFPLNYPINAEQTWTISTNSDGYVISLETRDFNIQYDDSCMFDFVQLYDGSDASAVSFGRWCGTRGPIKESSGASMFVKFQSDNLQSYGGFKLAFSAKKPSKNRQATNVGGIVGGGFGAITLVFILICCCASYNRKKSQSLRNRNVVNNGSYPNSIYSISPTGHLGHASTQRVMYTPSLTYPTTQSLMYTPPRAIPPSQPTVYTPPPAYNEVVTDAPPLYSDVINTFTNDPSAYQVVDNPSCHL
ncbi:tolloid-like protein 2 isoform X2 [Haliotis rufescens]|uniref:tolloid-like protein 2 isoform X2 n=1 Tax=Haliotis rufescens TaxID=6454 RepID=UPI001EAFEBC8|nr:tolloid-like protein 2 isoform X2 [Haliotis rufescens]